MPSPLSAYPGALVTADYQELLDHPEINAIAIATPARTHFPLAYAAMMADKDVLVEKPITATVAEAEELICPGPPRCRRILAVDHTRVKSPGESRRSRN